MTQFYLDSTFDQMQTMQGRQNVAARVGACHSFSLHWCAMMYAGPDPADPDARMARLRSNRGGASPVLQKAYLDASGENDRDWRSWDDLGVAVHGLTRVEYAFDHGPFDQATVRGVVKAPKFDGMIYTFSYPSASAGDDSDHTIAFFRKLKGQRGIASPLPDDRINVYDANYGEYSIPPLEFNYWLNKYKQSYNGQISYHRLFYVKKR